jgi:hypothetical protein
MSTTVSSPAPAVDMAIAPTIFLITHPTQPAKALSIVKPAFNELKGMVIATFGDIFEKEKETPRHYLVYAYEGMDVRIETHDDFAFCLAKHTEQPRIVLAIKDEGNWARKQQQEVAAAVTRIFAPVTLIDPTTYPYRYDPLRW